MNTTTTTTTTNTTISPSQKPTENAGDQGAHARRNDFLLECTVRQKVRAEKSRRRHALEQVIERIVLENKKYTFEPGLLQRKRNTRNRDNVDLQLDGSFVLLDDPFPPLVTNLLPWPLNGRDALPGGCPCSQYYLPSWMMTRVMAFQTGIHHRPTASPRAHVPTAHASPTSHRPNILNLPRQRRSAPTRKRRVDHAELPTIHGEALAYPTTAHPLPSWRGTSAGSTGRTSTWERWCLVWCVFEEETSGVMESQGR